MSRPNFFEHLHPPTIPAREARFTYTFGLGGMSLLLFLVLAVTGVPLMFVYVPTTTAAAKAIRSITYVAPYGWLLRNMHYWAAVLLLLATGLHLLRVALSGGYKKPRQFNWLIGFVILLFSMLLSFSGYVLRWDVDTFGALTVGTNIVREIPLLGGWLYSLVVGGTSIGDATVVRFYTWHTLGLSIPVIVLIGWHIFRVRRDGGISHQSSVVSRQSSVANPQSPPPKRRISRRELVRREGIAMLALLILLFTLSLFFDAPLAPPVDPLAAPGTAVSKIEAPWFFLWIQALLRHLPPLWAGVIIPLVTAVILAVLPWTLDRSETGTAVWFNREGRLAQVVVLFIAAGIILLTMVELAG